MHWYKRNIGDYYKKAGRLSMQQHGAYTLLIDACYDREQFPTEEQAIEWVWASTEAEIEAVRFVLRKFFTEVDGVFVQSRISDELTDYRDKADKNRQIAIDREAKRRENRTNKHDSCTGGLHNEHESPPNQEPVTSNQEPITNNDKKQGSQKLDFSSWPCMPSDELMSEWKQLRKRLKAGVTQTVINRTGKELHIAVKAGFTVDQCFEQWVYKGWRGFEASWMMSQKPDLQPQQQSKQPRAFGS
jgi:uncharacterized protein YdaU (DUF1376 family)